MEDTAQGVVESCHSQAVLNELHTAEDHWSNPHQEAESHLQAGLWLLPKPSMAASPLPTLAPLPPSTALILLFYFIYLLFWQHALHHNYLTHHPLSHCPYLRTFFLSHVSLVCCTSWERSPDQNVLEFNYQKALDIELSIINHLPLRSNEPLQYLSNNQVNKKQIKLHK